jgi:hypothetical protein
MVTKAKVKTPARRPAKPLKTTEDVEDVLDLFQTSQNDDATTLHWFRSNSDIAKLVMAWRKVNVKQIESKEPLPSRLADQWSWLWRHYSFSLSDWLSLVGIQDLRYGVRLITRVIRLRLVFPDNTYPGWLDRYITISAIYETDRKTPKAQRVGKEPEEDDKKKTMPVELGEEEETEEAETE